MIRFVLVSDVSNSTLNSFLAKSTNSTLFIPLRDDLVILPDFLPFLLPPLTLKGLVGVTQRGIAGRGDESIRRLWTADEVIPNC